MSAYRQTLQIALAGVQGPLPESLNSLAAQWGAPDTPVQALYQAATVLTQAERCARALPRNTAAAPPLAAPETLKAPDGFFASLLARGLDRPNAFVERDKAELLSARGEHLPHALLPGWLNYALSCTPPEQAVLMACTGARGPWLAALNPDWQPLLNHVPDERHWETGTLAERAHWLTVLRRHDPAAGRDALQAVWPNEPPEARDKLLACLSAGLSHDDEALLESARMDKRKEVRRLALNLLAELPHSAFSQRLLVRATEWLAYTPGGLLRSAKLEVRLPTAYDKAWAFDGIPEKTTRQLEKIGDKANWLVEVLSQVPLNALLARLQIDARIWPKLIDGHEYAAALWAGSMASFERYPSPEILACMITSPSDLRAQMQKIAVRAAANSGQLDEWLTPLMNESFNLGAAIALLPRLDAHWSRTLLKRLHPTIDANLGQPMYWTELLPRFAERVHADVLPEFLAFLDPLGNELYAAKAVASAVEIADLRHKLHQHHPEKIS
jgi:hypothetical protein